MIVVSDTSLMNYLLLLGIENILPTLFGSVFVPHSVIKELVHHRSPSVVRQWALNPPSWLEIREPTIPISNKNLDRGEADAIALACELKADIILIDDDRGRRAAERLGLRASGTLAVLLLAGEQGLIKLEDVVEQLMKTNFRISQEQLDRLRNRGI